MVSFRMDNTTLGNLSWLHLSDFLLNFHPTVATYAFSLVVRLPINIFVVLVILSKRWVSSETSVLKEAVVQIFISLYDAVSIALIFYPDNYLLHTWFALDVILVIGHPSILTVTSVDQYLAVVKPLLYIRLKPVKCGLPLGGLICLWILAVFITSLFRIVVFFWAAVVHSTVCCAIQLYCFAVMVWALKRPGPGETGGRDVRMSAMKLRAVKIILWSIVRILLVSTPLAVIFTVNLYVRSATQRLAIVSQVCYATGSLVDFVQALIFLQRTGKINVFQCL